MITMVNKRSKIERRRSGTRLSDSLSVSSVVSEIDGELVIVNSDDLLIGYNSGLLADGFTEYDIRSMGVRNYTRTFPISDTVSDFVIDEDTLDLYFTQRNTNNELINRFDLESYDLVWTSGSSKLLDAVEVALFGNDKLVVGSQNGRYGVWDRDGNEIWSNDDLGGVGPPTNEITSGVGSYQGNAYYAFGNVLSFDCGITIRDGDNGNDIQTVINPDWLNDPNGTMDYFDELIISDDGIIYITGVHELQGSWLFAIDANDLTDVIWEYSTDSISQDLIILNDSIITVTNGGYIRSNDRLTGALEWENQITSSSNSPVSLDIDDTGEIIYVGTGQGEMFKVTNPDGNIIESFDDIAPPNLDEGFDELYFSPGVIGSTPLFKTMVLAGNYSFNRPMFSPSGNFFTFIDDALEILEVNEIDEIWNQQYFWLGSSGGFFGQYDWMENKDELAWPLRNFSGDDYVDIINLENGFNNTVTIDITGRPSSDVPLFARYINGDDELIVGVYDNSVPEVDFNVYETTNYTQVNSIQSVNIPEFSRPERKMAGEGLLAYAQDFGNSGFEVRETTNLSVVEQNNLGGEIVESVFLTEGDEALVVGTRSGNIYVFDPNSNYNQVQSLQPVGNLEINGFGFIPSNNLLAIGGGNIILIDTSQGLGNWVVSGDQGIITASGGLPSSISSDPTSNLFTFNTGTVVQTWDLPTLLKVLD